MLQLRSSGCAFMALCCFLVLIAVSEVTDPSEVDALIKIKKSLFDPMNHLRNWNKGDPCSSNWTGIICFNVKASDEYLHVQEIQLLKMNLSGQLAPELGQFSHLQILDFMWNEINGSIPKEIGNISSLRLLLLNGNKLSGSLPDEIGYMSNLNRLQVDQNHISGAIPKSFGNLSSVKHIHMNNNSISGQIPSEFSQLSVLLHLLLDNNNLSGPLPPELSNMSALRILQLDNNNFSGSEIPATFANLSKLAKLSLRNCSLNGAIPDLSSIFDLFYLDLSWNKLTGPLPSKISDNMTTIKLSDNHLNGSIPGSFSNLHLLQTLSLENNMLTGSIPTDIWETMVFNTTDRLAIDLRNNRLATIVGELSPPENVILRFGGNPICSSANIPNISKFCRSEVNGFGATETSSNSTSCPAQACPTDYFFEYVPASPLPCFCAAPLRIGYRLKSPSFSYFPPHIYSFEQYLTNSLRMDLYQLSIDSYSWDGARLRMYVKLFPGVHSNTFNLSEVQRIRGIYTSWDFPRNDFFGPYELLNFTLLGPYSHMNFDTHATTISKGALISIILGAIACVVAASALVTLCILRRHVRYGRKLSRNQLSSRASMTIEGVKAFTFREMALATDNFNNSAEVGRGGYGKVYRGILADKMVVAIKRAEEGSLQGQKEFLTEIKLLSRLHHRSLVSLVGYCDEEGDQMLVYEFMPNGTLRDWLSARVKEQLNFAMRLSIALGSARGILYLHTEANPPVFHRDIKSSNILLDSKLTAKVADFGLSRLAPVLDDEGNMPNHVSTVVRGTPGYLDPEYFLTHKLTDKSDVYSLGIVFLELLTGMHPISHGKNIVREVNTARNTGTMFSVIDSRMGSYPSECVEIFVSLALACCQDNPDRRPSMLEVVRELEYIQKTMPGSGDQAVSGSIQVEESTSSSSTNTHTGNAMWSSAFFYSRDTSNSSSNVLGSDLTSGVVPTISPR